MYDPIDDIINCQTQSFTPSQEDDGGGVSVSVSVPDSSDASPVESPFPKPDPGDSPTAVPPDILEQMREKSKNSLYFFAKFVLGYKDFVKHVHRPICRTLQAPDRRIRVILPRGWFKTTLISIAYPIWEAIRDPNVRILIAQNTFLNAQAKLRAIREQIEGNQLLRRLFPEIIPDSTCKWGSESLCIPRTARFPESTFECAGVRTQVTSRHYDIIIEDDTVAPDFNELGMENVVPTKDDIDQAIGWHRLALPLLVHPSKSRIIVVGTRWFELDLLSWIEKNEPYYTSYVRSCKETDGQPDPKGVLTFPERFDETTLASLEISMGPYLFSCLYLNTPLASEMMIFRKEWFKYYESLPYSRNTVFYCAVDLAGDPKVNKGKSGDYNVVMTTAKDLETGIIYVVDYWRKRANPGEVINEIFRQYNLYKFVKLGIEAIAYQGTLCYWVEERRRKMPDVYFTIEPVTYGNRSKEARVRGLQPLFAAGNILLRTWMSELCTQLETFPLGAHDDIADTLAEHLILWTATRTARRKDPKDPNTYDELSLDRALVEMERRHSHESDPTNIMNLLDDNVEDRKKTITSAERMQRHPQFVDHIVDVRPAVEARLNADIATLFGESSGADNLYLI
jgi:predicted phage terminase large subunit-like protein